MARTKKNADKAAANAQEGREELDMNMDTPGEQEASEAAQEGAAARETIGPDGLADLLGCEDADEAELEEGLLDEYAVAAEGGLNLREGPSLDAPLLATLPCGAGVFADGEAEDGWLPVTTGLLSGYMLAEHLVPLAPDMAMDYD